MIQFNTTQLIYRSEPEREIYLEGRGWTKARDILVGDRLSNHDGTYTVILSVYVRESEVEITVLEPPGFPRGAETRLAPLRTLWERL